jgi:hypothetical protein
MRNILLLFVLLFCISAFPQDTLVFISGDTVAVEVLTVDTVHGLIHYVFLGDTIIVADRNINISKIHSNTGSSIPGIYYKANISPSDRFEEKYGLLNRPVADRSNSLAISIYLTALLESSPRNFRIHSTMNRVLLLEPEYLISNKLSLKMPLGIGISKVEPPLNSHVWDMYSGYYYDSLPLILDTNRIINSHWAYSIVHPMNLKFQLGFYAKHSFNFSRKSYFYLSEGIDFGLADIYSLELYYSQVYNIDQYWELNEERIEVKTNNIFFFNAKVIGGLSLGIGKSVALNVDGGVSLRISGKSNKEDLIFQSINHSDYELIYINKYEPEIYTAKIFFRLALLYYLPWKI